MKELLDDVQKELQGDPRLDYVAIAGGVIFTHDMEHFPLQQKLPCIALEDQQTGDIKHWSSRTREMSFSIQVHVVQQFFDREALLVGDDFDKSVNEMAKDVRDILDMNRLGGKYSRFLLKSESKTTMFEQKSMFIMEKGLTFEAVRIE